MPIFKLIKNDDILATSPEPWVYYPEDGGMWRSGNVGYQGGEELTQVGIRTLMTPIRFKAQFSIMEQVEIKRARSYIGNDDAAKATARDVLDILFGSLDDPRLTEVDVADPAVIDGIDFCHSIGILTAERAAAIKRGISI